MARRLVSADLTRPYHPYVNKDGEEKLATLTVDSLLKIRKRRAEKKKRVVIRHKREL